MDRDALGSWMSGPGTRAGAAERAYPGQRLGLPETGAGSVAGWGQRLAAITIDWFVALGVTMALLGPPDPGDQTFSMVTLVIFAVMYAILLLTLHRTLGMAALRVRVVPVGSPRLLVWGVLVRTLLLVLVVPAVIYDRDRRGLHDKLGHTLVARDR